MNFVLIFNRQTLSFNKITFKLGGSSSRIFSKFGYNIKIRGKKDLYGRTQFKLRPDAREATFMRTKLASDFHARLGIKTISSNYANLYINGEFMGFYVLMDSIKKSWIEAEYGDIETSTLYECSSTGNDLTVEASGKKCVNANKNVTDTSEFMKFLTDLNAAQTIEEVEKFFDVDLFLTEMAYEYLFGSWDHYLIYGHNFLLYKPAGSVIWKYIITDFDGDIGQDISMGITGIVPVPVLPTNLDFVNYTFKEWAYFPRHIIDVLIFKDSTRFDNILKKLVKEIFNPATLFPHIDEIKKFIKPYVEKDKTPDKNGKLPGRLHEETEDYTMEEWDANSEFTTICSAQCSRAYGLKYWILAKYRHVCKAYSIECDPTYMDENYKYTVDKNVERPITEDAWLIYDYEEPKKNSKKLTSNEGDNDSSGAFKKPIISFVFLYSILTLILLI